VVLVLARRDVDLGNIRAAGSGTDHQFAVAVESRRRYAPVVFLALGQIDGQIIVKGDLLPRTS
jgi:hypothetical protein